MPLDPATHGLIRLASAIATGRAELIRERALLARRDGVASIWVDELLLQSVLMVGYPRALTGAAVWRELAEGPAASLEDGTDFGNHPLWRARGEDTCRTIYGSNYDRLRANVRRLHPALDSWMVVEGYGRTLARPGLDLVRRELCVIAQVAVLGAERQLHSHLRGALHAGAGRDQISLTVEVVVPDCGPAEARVARALWERVAP